MKKKYYEYDKKRRKLAKLYSKQKLIMHLGNDIVIPILFFISLFLLGFFKLLSSFSLNFGLIAGSTIFIFLISLLLTIAQFPIRVYAGFIYEHKFGLSNQNFQSWLVDYLKMSLIGFIFMIPIGTLTAILAQITTLWWLISAIISIIFIVVIDFIFPIVILPFLYKLEPYKDKKELKVILDITRKVGASDLRHVKVLNESEKSTKVNAMFAGFGSSKSVILYDNLIDKFPKREMRTVIGHELGHYVNKDTLRFIILESIETIISLFLADLLIRIIILKSNSIPLEIVPMLTLFLLCFGFLLSPITSWYSRRQETQADIFALKHIRDPHAQISTEKRLVDLDLGDESPNPIVEFWLHSHPSAEKRIKLCQQWIKENKNYIKG